MAAAGRVSELHGKAIGVGIAAAAVIRIYCFAATKGVWLL